MPETRSAVVTGASRGLGLASAAHLHAQGWRVVGAMRSPDAGLERLRAATGAAAGDPRLVGVRLDLLDAASVAEAAKEIEAAGGAARSYGVDVADREALTALVEAVRADLGPIDIVVNNAGFAMTGRFAEVSAGPDDDVAAIRRAATAPGDREAMAVWARHIASIEARSRRLESALLTPA